MTGTTAAPREGDARGTRCTGCRAALGRRRSFLFQGEGGPLVKCARCALCHRPMLARSLWVSLLVGTILIAINQGDVLLRGEWRTSFAWKLPLTYMVPFLVATWGALGNSRVRL